MNQDDWSSGRNSTHSCHNRNSNKYTTSVNCSAAASVNNDSQDSTNNLTRSATELSTTTSSVKNSNRAPLVVTVDLNAKTFIGKRRDRFHPRAKQRCNSVPNLLSGLDSLPACMSSGDSSKRRDDCKIGIVMFQCCVYDFMSNIQDVPS